MTGCPGAPEEKLELTSCAARSLAAIPLVCALAASAGAEETPRQVVDRINAVLIEVMRDARALGFDGRYKRLAPVLTQTFNFPFMARVIAGQFWKDFGAAQQERLIDAFARISIATFAARFDSHSGELFEVLGQRPAMRESVMVENRLVKSSGEIVSINYLLRKFDGAWRVADVFLDGKYSELAIKRSEYGSILRRGGVEALLRRLEDKVAELKAKSRN